MLLVIFLISFCHYRCYSFPVKESDDSAISSYCNLQNGNTELDCAKIKFAGQTAGVKIKLKTCEQPLRINFRIIISILSIDWSKDIEANQEFPIPGFEYKAFGIGGKVYVRVNLYKENENIKLQVVLKVEFSVSDAPVLAPKVTVYDGLIEINENCRGSGWDSYSTGEKVGIIIAIVISLIIFLVVVIYLLRRYHSKCKRTTSWSTRKKQYNKGGGTVMQNVNNYEKKQTEANKTNIKKAGKKGPQKFVPKPV